MSITSKKELSARQRYAFFCFRAVCGVFFVMEISAIAALCLLNPNNHLLNWRTVLLTDLFAFGFLFGNERVNTTGAVLLGALSALLAVFFMYFMRTHGITSTDWIFG